jgi:hypothetical protein
MIRKPPAHWQQLSEGAAVRTVRTAAGIAKGGARVARCGVHVARGLVCYLFAAIYGFFAIGSSLSLPSLIGIGAMAAFAFWVGNRAFAKALKASG